jgi:hypothetical protein
MLPTHLCLGFPSGLFPSGFTTNSLQAVFSPPFGYMPHSPHPHRRDHSNYTWQSVQIMQLFIMHFSPPSHHFIRFQSKYSPQRPVLKHPQSVLT